MLTSTIKMFNNNFIRNSLLCLSILLNSYALFADDTAAYYTHYFNYNRRALELHSYSTLVESDDRLQIDTNLFRLEDSAFFIEDYESINAKLTQLSREEVISSPFFQSQRNKISTFSHEKIDHKTNKNLITHYYLNGPYYSNSVHSFKNISLPDINNAQSDYHTYPAEPDMYNTVDIEESFPFKKQNVFFIFSEFTITNEADYIFQLGKNGFVEVFIDGKKISANYKRHSFYPVQYFSRIHLTQGKHRIVIKTGAGESNHSISYALIPYSSIYASIADSGLYTAEKLYGPQTDEEIFNTAYILYKTGLTTHGMADSLYLRLKSNSTLYHPSLYYLYLMSESSNESLNLLNTMNTIQKTPRGVYNAALYLSYHGMFDRAVEYMNDPDKYYSNNLVKNYIYSQLYKHKGWYFKSLEACKALEEQLPYTAAQTRADIYYKQNRQKEALELYKNLINRYPLTRSYLTEYIAILKNSKRNHELQNVLFRSIHMFPESVSLRIQLAESLYNSGNINSAVTILASVKRKAPFHPDIYYLLSKCYLFSENRGLAYRFAQKAVSLNPEDTQLSEYLKQNFQNDDYLNKYLHTYNITSLLAQAQQYKDEPAVLLFSEENEKIEPDGSSTKRIRKIYTINNSELCQDLKKHQFVINAHYDKILSMYISVTHNNRVYSSSSINKQSLSDPESRLYYDIELVSLDLPYFSDDCIVEIDYTLQSSEGVAYNGYFGTRSYFPDTYRTLKAYHTLTVPKSKQISNKLNHIPKSSFSVKERDSVISNITSITNQPPKIIEDNSIPYFNRVPSVTYSSFDSWDRFYSWYNSLIDEKISINETMRSELHTLLNGLTSDKEKLMAIYSFVTDRTRYVGFEAGIGGIQPRSTKETYTSALGDCKDIALLLAVLLQEAGFDAYLTLVRTYPKGKADLDIPYTGNFNHAICYVDFEGGLFLDGTVNNASIYDLPVSDRNATGMIIKKNGYEFKKITPDKYNKSQDLVHTTVQLMPDGSARMTRFLKKSGPSAVFFKNSYETDKKQIQYLTQYWNSVYPGSQISGYSVTGLKTLHPVEYSYTITIPHYFETGGEYSHIPSHIIPARLTPHITPKISRFNDLFISYGSSSHSVTTYILPDNYTLYSLPEKTNTETNIFNSTTEFTKDKNSFTVTYNRTYKSGTVEAYKIFREKLLTHDAHNAALIVIKKKM